MTVLAAIDGDATPSPVLAVARRIAVAFDEPLRALHVMPNATFEAIRGERTQRGRYPVGEALFSPSELREPEGGTGPQEFYIDDAAEQAGRLAEQVADATFDDGEGVAFEGRVGDPATEILEEAVRCEASLIVIGGRKRSPVGKAIFGSVTQSILLNAESPVVTVPGGGADQPADGPVVAAVDQSERARNILERAGALSTAFDVELHVVHVRRGRTDAEREVENGDQSGGSADGADAHATAASVVADAPVSLDREYTPVELVGRPGAQIVEYAMSERASFIVASGRKRSPVGKVLFGSVTQAILLRADCPVLTTMA